jgi:signal transduction histidine kinase
MDVLNRLLRHDLRNDLNVAYGNLQNAQSRVDDEDVSEHLEQVEDALARVINRSERARSLGELLEQAYELDNRPVRLDQVLHETLVEAINRFEDARFRFETFPETRVVADHLLKTVFTAVLENAVIHNDAELPTVDVTVEERAEDVVVRIVDNGPGVPEGAVDLIFGREELDQLHYGSGISLFFADAVVRSYNGDIDVDADRSEGAEFRIRLNKPSTTDR